MDESQVVLLKASSGKLVGMPLTFPPVATETSYGDGTFRHLLQARLGLRTTPGTEGCTLPVRSVSAKAAALAKTQGKHLELHTPCGEPVDAGGLHPYQCPRGRGWQAVRHDEIVLANIAGLAMINIRSAPPGEMVGLSDRNPAHKVAPDQEFTWPGSARKSLLDAFVTFLSLIHI